MFDKNSFDAFHDEQNFPRRRQRSRARRMRPKSKMTIYEYIARKVPADAHYTINKFGSYPRAQNSQELENQLRTFVKSFGEKGLTELSKIPPDKDLIQEHCSKCEEREGKNSEMKCLIEAHNKMLNASGNTAPTPSPTADNTDKIVGKVNSNMLIMGGFVIMAVALLIKFKK